ncbi:family 78 glycoside hydrolase catalytic domain [Arthrobacter sp. S39]|uniref:family 78 glycoside hydrolase catalytic domain n=1 Tax=Arthrobacter sp. S39 TaxID=2509720 RepID=UPI0013EF70F2|nr:family 78 glycoside hydrolase catalytic domain [Arthrobacter sp. S39]
MPIAVSSLTLNKRVCPLGIDSPCPEFAWKVLGDAQEWFELEVSLDGDFTSESVIWQPGWLQDPVPFGHIYAGPELNSATRYWWRVRTRADGTESSWSPPAWFETGLLHKDDWVGQWITDSKPDSSGTLYFRSDVELPSGVAKARAYVSALGWYKLWLNGENITERALVPRFTPFDDYVEYQAYDITEALQPGTNAVGVVVSEGRFRGRLGAFSKPARFGDQLAAIVQLEVELQDGRRLRHGSDLAWTVGDGPISLSDPKFGERADLRVSTVDWTRPGAQPQRARAVDPLPPNPRRLIAEEVERVTEVGRIPGRVTTTPAGVQLIDFDQNFNGHARVRLAGTPGTKVMISYSEVLTPEGELNTEYLHFPGSKQQDGWFQRDEVILPGGAIEYEPTFAVRGFRYIAIEGDISPLADGDAEGVVVSTDLQLTGHFDCSDPRLVRLWRNSRWSMISNFADTPTDCPTRERSGWTGDIQIFGPTAAVLGDTDTYLRRYLRNLAADQFDDGTIPPVIPAETSAFVPKKDKMQELARTSVGWGDVSVMLPWTLYQYFGDVQVLERQYESAKSWVRFLERRGLKRGVARRIGRRVGPLEDYILDTGFNWGEWLRPGEGPASQMGGNLLTGRPEVATAYFAHSAQLLSRIAGVLGRVRDGEHFAEVGVNAKEAYNAAFVRRGGSRIGADRQDDYVRALAFDLLPESARPDATDRLVELIENNDGHLDTGFLSTALLLPVLCDHGREDIAWRVLLNPSAPSWLAQIDQGATTIWETWDGHDKKGRPADSHNHYAFGSVSQWLHEYVAGVRPLEPGYRKFLVAPTFGPLSYASTNISTPYGNVSAKWERSDTSAFLSLTAPPGTEAVIQVEGLSRNVGAGTHEFGWPVGNAHDSILGRTDSRSAYTGEADAIAGAGGIKQ